MNIGIDKIGFYTPNYFLDLKTLAIARNIDPEKYYVGLGQRKMSVLPPGEDIVTMAANAASKILADEDLSQIEMLLFATESGIDFSKAAGIYVHKLLNLPNRCRIVELKQACYSATMGLQIALPYLQQNPTKKILLIASDVARYGLNTPAESSQGSGAIAMLLTANPRILTIENGSGIYCEDVMDFWRPNYCSEAQVDGRYSCDLYLRVLEECWNQYINITGRDFENHERFCYHVPVPRLVEKAHKRLIKINSQNALSKNANPESQVAASLIYGRETGNCYSAALYLAILSLLENDPENLAGSRIGLYSYGSGCVGEFYSAIVNKNYHEVLNTLANQEMLKLREELDYASYEKIYNFTFPEDGADFLLPEYKTGKFRLNALSKHKRIYSQKDNNHA